jgi:hypothetical protein
VHKQKVPPLLKSLRRARWSAARRDPRRYRSVRRSVHRSVRRSVHRSVHLGPALHLFLF